MSYSRKLYELFSDAFYKLIIRSENLSCNLRIKFSYDKLI